MLRTSNRQQWVNLVSSKFFWFPLFYYQSSAPMVIDYCHLLLLNHTVINIIQSLCCFPYIYWILNLSLMIIVCDEAMGRNLRTSKLPGVYSTAELLPSEVLRRSLRLFIQFLFSGTYIGCEQRRTYCILLFRIYIQDSSCKILRRILFL